MQTLINVQQIIYKMRFIFNKEQRNTGKSMNALAL